MWEDNGCAKWESGKEQLKKVAYVMIMSLKSYVFQKRIEECRQKNCYLVWTCDVFRLFNNTLL